LYKDTKIHYTLTEATRIAFEKGNDLKIHDFHEIDLLHYRGTDSLIEFLQSQNITEKSYILDLGAGFGGSSRLIASKYGCFVNAIEILPNNVRVGFVLNRLQGLHDKVRFYCFDVTQLDFAEHPSLDSTHPVLISQLTMLHVSNKPKLYQNTARLLQPDGAFYIEDYFLKDGMQFTPEEKSKLENDVGVPNGYLPTKEEYIAFLENNGLEVTCWKDLTEEWTRFVWKRYSDFLEKMEENKTSHGEDFVKEQCHFYKQVATLFHGDEQFRKQFKNAHNQVGDNLPLQQHLGGVLIIGKKRK